MTGGEYIEMNLSDDEIDEIEDINRNTNRESALKQN